MKTIAIPALQTEESIGAIGPFEILHKTRGLWRHLSQGDSAPLFDVQIVGLDRKPIVYATGITVLPTTTIRRCKPDIIVVPSIDEEIANCLEKNAPYISWVRKCFQNGAHVSSLCTGAFVLGAAGVLDHKKATTHWFFAEQFKKRFPQTVLRPDRLIVDEGDVVTCGAATSFLNLMIYLVDKYFGHELAVYASKIFLIDMDRTSQLPYRIFFPTTEHKDSAIARSQEYIHDRFKSSIRLEGLAKRAGMSPRNFARRFREATGESVATYIQKLRIEAAKRLFESSDLSISQATFQVGYNDERSFRRLFRKHTRLSPRSYRAKFHLDSSKAAKG